MLMGEKAIKLSNCAIHSEFLIIAYETVSKHQYLTIIDLLTLKQLYHREMKLKIISILSFGEGEAT